MFKKGISLLSSITIASIASTSVVSCIAPQYANGIEGQRVVLATDGGHIDDRSFNEDAFEGITNYVRSEYNIPSYNDYVEAQNSTTNSIISAYKMALVKKADALVMPGFTHMATIQQASSFLKDKTLVLIDGMVPPKEEDPRMKNVISVLFNSQLAGFQAGYDAISWATQKDENGHMIGDVSGNDNTITIGTFAGATNKYGVDNYMWGMILAVDVFNKIHENDKGFIKVKLANSKDGTVSGLALSNDSDPALFSGSFDIGDGIKSRIVPKLVDDKKSDIIFPVAGPQINDVITFQSNKGYTPFLIGVDVDQADAYPTAGNQGRFITAATKNIHSAVKKSLEHAESLIDKNGQKHTDVWDGTNPTPFRDWSISLTKKDNPKYRLSKHFLELSTGNLGEQVGNDEEDDLINFINTSFANAGLSATEYLNGKNISKIADKLIEEFAEQIKEGEKDNG